MAAAEVDMLGGMGLVEDRSGSQAAGVHVPNLEGGLEGSHKDRMVTVGLEKVDKVAVDLDMVDKVPVEADTAVVEILEEGLEVLHTIVDMENH
jgi:hypothetical protein